MRAALHLFDLYSVTTSDEHVIDIKNQIDPKLVGQLSNVHAWAEV